MNKKLFGTRFVRILCAVLISALGILAAACGSKKQAVDMTADGNVTVVGEGSTVFTFQMKDADGKVFEWEVHTDEKTVGEALLKVGLIEGESGEYGIYVKKVNGIEADYDKDQAYWAFYVDGEYGMSAADLTEIEAGKVYAFVYEKG